MIQRFLFSFLCLFFSPSNLIAQESCPEKLLKANTLYEQGNINDAIEISKTCTSSNDITDQWQAYRLLAMAYLVNNDKQNAQDAVEKMLNLNPTYRPSKLKDPVELIKLISGITVFPKFTLGLAVSAGTNTSLINVKKGYGLANYSKNYSSKSGFQFGTNAGFYLNPRFIISIGLLATQKNYAIDYDLANWVVEIEERLSYIEAPLTLKYLFRPNKRLRFFIEGGVYAGYLIYDQQDFKANYIPENQKFELRKLSAIDRRNRWNYGIDFGLGSYFKMKTGHVSVQANYFQSLTKVNNPSTRFDNTELMYTYFYLDDDFTINNVAVSLGYTKYLSYKVYKGKKK